MITMTMHNRKVALYTSNATQYTLLLEAYEQGPITDSDIIVEKISGWNDFDSVEIGTQPKINGGSFITYTRVAERNIDITLNINDPDTSNILLKCKQKMFTFADINIRRYSYKNETEVRREDLIGKISSVGWERVGDSNYQLKLTFLCPDPVKKIYLNGSATAEAEGAL